MIRLLLAFLLAGITTSAYAAPVVIAVALYAAEVITVTQLIITVGVYLYGTMQQRKSEKKMRAAQQAERSAYNASLRDRTTTALTAEAAHLYVYGRSRVGSAIVAMFTTGDRDEFKHLVCVHAAHECDGIENIWVSGKLVSTRDSDGWVTLPPFRSETTESGTQNGFAPSVTLDHLPIAGTVTARTIGPEDIYYEVQVEVSGNVVTIPELPDGWPFIVSYQYLLGHSHLKIVTHLGTPDDPADAYLMSVTNGLWSASAVLRGFCYSVVTLGLDEPEFQGGIPPIEVLLRGKKIYDPRTALTAWSENNALVIRDYLTSEVCMVPAIDVPEDYVIAAANICDEDVGGGMKRYTFNGTVSSDESKDAVLEKMAESMAGGITSTTWEITAGAYAAPVMALDQSDIVGDLALTPGLSDASIYNGVRGQFISPENDYVVTDFKPYQNSTYVAADNGRELWSNIDFPYTNTLQRVWNLNRIYVEDQRNAFTVKATFSLKAWRLRIGQRVTLSSTVFGWDEKVFRVTDKKFSPDSPVELTLKEDGPTIWDLADSVTPDDTPNTNLPDPFFVPKLASLTCESGTDLLIAKDGTIISRIKVTWPQSESQSVVANGHIDIEWNKEGSGTWDRVQATGSDTSTFISPVEDGSWYTVRARPVNTFLNVKADWTYAGIHQVIGKTAPPADMQSLAISGDILSWVPNTELDLAGYVFRFHYGSNFDWNSAAPLHQGVIVASPFQLVARPHGTVTIMGKVIDTSGNMSINSANVVTDLGDTPIANVVEVFDLEASGFPGDKENCAVVGGDLIADEIDSFYGTDNQSFYGTDTASKYAASSYSQMVYTTEEISISSALAGSYVSLLIEYEGVDLTIEYRLVGPGPVYGVDGDSFYGSDDDSFYDEPNAWTLWPGQVLAINDVYQWRITIGAGAVRGEIHELSIILDAPDIVEYIEDIAITAGGAVIPYTSSFTVIKTVTATLQANLTGAETLEVDKTINLSPKLRAYNSSHTAVSGASADATLKGY